MFTIAEPVAVSDSQSLKFGTRGCGTPLLGWAICTHSNKYEDLNWSGIQNADLLKSMIIRLRTRPAQTAFKWVKGHDDNYGNDRADALADAGRDNNSSVRLDEDEWIDSHPALQDGARLQALEASNMYDQLLKWHTRKIIPIPRQEVLDDAKDKIEEGGPQTRNY